MFINEAYAATAGVADAGSVSGVFIQLALVLLIFYFFLIRPQQKRIKEHSDMVQALKVGDRVLTSGGVYGKVTKLEEREVSLEVAEGVVISVDRMSVSALVEAPVKASAHKEKTVKTTKKEKKK